MKQFIKAEEISVKELLAFVDHFNLRKENTIRFFAVILFILFGYNAEKNSEVHIITSDNLLAVYLLDNQIYPSSYPTIFTPATDSFIYVPKRSLDIQGNSSTFGNYTVSIFPQEVNNPAGIAV